MDEQLYVLHFVSAVTPQEIIRNVDVPKSELYSSGGQAYTFDREQRMNYTTNRTLHLQSIHGPLRGKWIK